MGSLTTFVTSSHVQLPPHIHLLNPNPQHFHNPFHSPTSEIPYDYHMMRFVTSHPISYPYYGIFSLHTPLSVNLIYQLLFSGLVFRLFNQQLSASHQTFTV